MPSFLILHGLENHRPPEHWQFQLAASLVHAGHQVLYPGLPEPDAPRLDAWTAALHDGLDALEGEDRVVVCHSLGCMLWLRAAAGLTEAQRPDRVLLVAPPGSAVLPEHVAEFRAPSPDVAAVLGSARGELAIVCSDDDPWNPIGAQAEYADPLGVTAIVVPGAGHINPDSGFGRWPWVEQWCLGSDGSGPPTA